MAGRHAFTKLAASSWWMQRALGGFPTPKMNCTTNTGVEARATSCTQHQNTCFSNTYTLTTIIAIYMKF